MIVRLLTLVCLLLGDFCMPDLVEHATLPSSLSSRVYVHLRVRQIKFADGLTDVVFCSCAHPTSQRIRESLWPTLSTRMTSKEFQAHICSSFSSVPFLCRHAAAVRLLNESIRHADTSLTESQRLLPSDVSLLSTPSATVPVSVCAMGRRNDFWSRRVCYLVGVKSGNYKWACSGCYSHMPAGACPHQQTLYHWRQLTGVSANAASAALRCLNDTHRHIGDRPLDLVSPAAQQAITYRALNGVKSMQASTRAPDRQMKCVCALASSAAASASTSASVSTTTQPRPFSSLPHPFLTVLSKQASSVTSSSSSSSSVSTNASPPISPPPSIVSAYVLHSRNTSVCQCGAKCRLCGSDWKTTSEPDEEVCALAMCLCLLKDEMIGSDVVHSVSWQRVHRRADKQVQVLKLHRVASLGWLSRCCLPLQQQDGFHV